MANKKQLWEKLLTEATVSRFPIRNDGVLEKEKYGSVDLCSEGKLQLQLIYTAWALVLGLYTSSQNPAFVAFNGANGTDASWSNLISARVIQTDLDPQRYISCISEAIQSEANREAVDICLDDYCEWSKPTEAGLPQNTLLVSNIDFDREKIENLLKNVRITPRNSACL
jgi:hypothetical protein